MRDSECCIIRGPFALYCLAEDQARICLDPFIWSIYLAPSQSMCESQLPVQPAFTFCMPVMEERSALPLPLLLLPRREKTPPFEDLAFASTCIADPAVSGITSP